MRNRRVRTSRRSGLLFTVRFGLLGHLVGFLNATWAGTAVENPGNAQVHALRTSEGVLLYLDQEGIVIEVDRVGRFANAYGFNEEGPVNDSDIPVGKWAAAVRQGIDADLNEDGLANHRDQAILIYLLDAYRKARTESAEGMGFASEKRVQQERYRSRENSAPKTQPSGPVNLLAPFPVNTTVPFPIDRGDEPGTPDFYKGLPLRLVDNGKPSVEAVDSVVGVVCIGRSFAKMETAEWKQRIGNGGDLSHEVAEQVVLVNCGVSGAGLDAWTDSDRETELWGTCIETNIPNAGISLDQVRVIYAKGVNDRHPPNRPPLPTYPKRHSNYERVLENLDELTERVPRLFTQSLLCILLHVRMAAIRATSPRAMRPAML